MVAHEAVERVNFTCNFEGSNSCKALLRDEDCVSQKMLRVCHLSPFLMVGVKRFHFDQLKKTPTRIQTRINLETMQDFRVYDRATGIVVAKSYSLCGAIIHVGETPDSGHYTSVSCRGDLWYYIDDEAGFPNFSVRCTGSRAVRMHLTLQ